MASVHRKDRSPFWMGKFTDATGRRVMRSTKQTDRKKALKVAEEWESAARKARRGELTQAASVKVLRNILDATTGDELDLPSIAESINGFLNNRETLGRSTSTAIRYKPIVASFLKNLGPVRANASIASLTSSEIERWRNCEVAEGKAPKTVNMELGVIRAALNECKRHGKILSNPAEAVDSVAGRSDEREPFSDEELAKLLIESGSSDWKTAILFGAWTGLRLVDISRLTWDQIDLKTSSLKVRPDKTDRALVIALAGELRDHLSTLKQKASNAPILPTLFGRSSGSNGALAGLSNEFGRLVKKAGIQVNLGKEKKGVGRRVSTKTFHSLRHSFVSRCAAGSTNETITKSMTGHSSDESFRRYVHLGLNLQQEALAKLPKLNR